MKHLYRVLVFGLLFLALVTVLRGNPLQAVQDWSDRYELRRHFKIPMGYELISYAGYPGMAGFGQREGLEISAVYRLTDHQVTKFVSDSKSDGWESLPIPWEVRSKISFREMAVPLEAHTGIYVCRTAGDEVLRARDTKPCSCVDRLNDVIIGVLDTTSNTLYLTIRSGY
jgi:hypothetical protein